MRFWRWATGGLLLVGTAALVWMIPALVGSTWSAIVRLVGAIPLRWLAVLGLVWIAGLIAHTPVLMSSMPRLTSRQALSLNLAGSAVANALPLGGPASVGLTTAMARSWGFGLEELGAFHTVSTLWNGVTRVVFGIVGVAWLLAIPGHGPLFGAIAVPLAAVSIGCAVALGRDSWSRSFGRALGSVADLADRLRRRPDRALSERTGAVLVAMRERSLEVIARSWPQMSLAMATYFTLLCVLLDLCLTVTDGPRMLGLVVAAVALERLVTALPITPGGAGVAELGLVGVLTLGGADPTVAVGATMLYRLFTFAMEIPVGLLVAAGWGIGSLSRRRRAGSGLASAS